MRSPWDVQGRSPMHRTIRDKPRILLYIQDGRTVHEYELRLLINWSYLIFGPDVGHLDSHVEPSRLQYASPKGQLAAWKRATTLKLDTLLGGVAAYCMQVNNISHTL